MPLSRSSSLFIVTLLFLSAFLVAPQRAMAQDNKDSVFFFAPLAEVNLYNMKKPSIGGGFIVGSDGKVAIGISGLYFHEVAKTETTEAKRILAMEFTMFLRVYFRNTNLGPFIQLNTGPLILFEEGDVSIPAMSGTMSASLSFGWRFPLGKYFFIEPAVRGGYPFIVGGGVAVGFRL